MSLELSIFKCTTALQVLTQIALIKGQHNEVEHGVHQKGKVLTFLDKYSFSLYFRLSRVQKDVISGLFVLSQIFGHFCPFIKSCSLLL